MNDTDILSLYRSGKREQAFRMLIQAYKERLYWHLRRFAQSHEDADDLLQETFIKIWTALPGFRGDSGLYTWVYRIATNEALNRMRRQRIRGFLNMEPLENVMRKIDDDPYFNGDELQAELHKAIEKLPPKQKVVFNLRYFDEMSYNDMAEILDTSANSLKVSYHHAYTKIKEELEKRF